MEDAMGLFIVAFVFFILSLIFLNGKGAFLIAGYNTMYNTMSDSEKAQYDEVALCKFMGKFMLGITACMVLMGISEWIDSQILFTTGSVFLLTLSIFALIHMKTGNRFKKKNTHI